MCSDERLEEIRRNNGNRSRQASQEINETIERVRVMDEETRILMNSILP